ncbi:MAG: NAD(P)H-dependent oxidoreductase [Bacteroidales bacterium]|nr:NAD(P)H-dependent oxidoreductase [Bacteroidales bacterium]
MENQLKIVALCGSLRKDSYNKKLIQLAQTLSPEQMTITLVPYDDVPYYNQYLDTPDAMPKSVSVFKQVLEEADGFLIVSPEFNYSIPGALKNALDWASRGNPSPLFGKPVSLMGATMGTLGTIQMQNVFLSFFRLMNMPLVLQPQILISQAQTKFDEVGNFTDEKGKQFIQQSLENLKLLILKR